MPARPRRARASRAQVSALEGLKHTPEFWAMHEAYCADPQLVDTAPCRRLARSPKSPRRKEAARRRREVRPRDRWFRDAEGAWDIHPTDHRWPDGERDEGASRHVGSNGVEL